MTTPGARTRCRVLCALALIALAWAFGRAGGRHVVVFGLLGIVAWVLMLKSGVHATIAGVLMAFALPARQLPEETELLGQRWKHACPQAPRSWWDPGGAAAP